MDAVILDVTYQPSGTTRETRRGLIMRGTAAAARFCQVARRALATGEPKRTAIALQKAYDTLSTLRRALESNQDEAATKRMRGICTFLEQQLTLAKRTDDMEVLISVTTVLADLNQACFQAAEKEAVQVDLSLNGLELVAFEDAPFARIPESTPRLAEVG